MRTRSATAYTEEFIVNEMKNDWWISKDNQLLFVWSEIYGWITGWKLYDILDDEDDNRYDEYSRTSKQIATSYDNYKKWFKTYIDTWIADADRRSADADRRISDAERRSAEAKEQAMRLDSIRIGNNLEEFYDTYIRNPNIVKQEEIDFMKKRTKEVVAQCQKYWID